MDEASDDESDNLRREASTREDRFWALGFREGLDLGKEETLEVSFTRGYDKGLAAGQSLGTGQGILAALQALQGRPGGAQGRLQALQAAAAGRERMLTPASTEAVCKALLHRLSFEGQAAGQPSQAGDAALDSCEEALTLLAELESGSAVLQQAVERTKSSPVSDRLTQPPSQ